VCLHNMGTIWGGKLFSVIISACVNQSMTILSKCFRVAKQRLREATQQAVDYLILCIAGICIGTIARVRDDSFGVASYGYTIMAVCKSASFVVFRLVNLHKLFKEQKKGCPVVKKGLS
jgi:hypothetical protein